MTDFQTSASAMQSASSGLTSTVSGMGNLFGVSDDMMKYAQAAASAASLVSGFAAGYKALVAIKEARNTIATAEATALTAANSITPIGWAKIALAVGAFATATIVTYEIMQYTLKEDTESTVGRNNILSSIGGII